MERGSHLGSLTDLSSLVIGPMLSATFCPSWGKTGHIRASLVSTTKSICECWALAGPGLLSGGRESKDMLGHHNVFP